MENEKSFVNYYLSFIFISIKNGEIISVDNTLSEKSYPYMDEAKKALVEYQESINTESSVILRDDESSQLIIIKKLEDAALTTIVGITTKKG